MKKFLVCLLSMMLLLNLVGCQDVSTKRDTFYVENLSNELPKETKEETIETTNTSIQTLINESKEIVIKKELISLNASYNIFIDDKKVGTITGKFVNMTGDVFTFKDINNNVLGKEKQIKRWGVKLNRLAEVLDETDNTMGYIGEDVIKDMFKIKTQFHFYDENKNEIGHTEKQILSLMDKITINNINNEEIAKIEKNFSITDKYTLKIYDNNNIPVNQLIYFICIFDAIQSSEK